MISDTKRGLLLLRGFCGTQRDAGFALIRWKEGGNSCFQEKLIKAALT